MYYSFSLNSFRLLPELIPLLITLALPILSYVLTSVALHTMANSRRIRHGWLAWLPIGNMWILGSLSDQYWFVKRGKYKSKRYLMMMLSLLMAAVTVIVAMDTIQGINGLLELNPNRIPQNRAFQVLMAYFAPAIIMLLPLAGLAIARLVFYCMALFDVFRSCDPETGTLFFLLSLFLPVTKPIFLMFDRHREKGMPPRKKPAAPVPPAPVIIEPEPEEPFPEPEAENVSEEDSGEDIVQF